MKSTTRWGWMVGLTLAVAGLSVAGLVLAAPPAAPKVSSFAPAKDVAGEIEKYVARLEEVVSSEAEYKDRGETQVPKDANTVVLLALAAGLHDEDVPCKSAAPAMLKAAREVAKAKGFEAAKTAVAGLRKAAESSGGDVSQLKWEKVADLPETMKAVPLVNNRLKRNIREKQFKKKAKDNSGDSATLAVIAQGSMADTSAAKTPEQEKQWYKFCEEMRENAAAVNKAVRKADLAATTKAVEVLTKSCDNCHEVFSPTAIGKADKAE